MAADATRGGAPGTVEVDLRPESEPRFAAIVALTGEHDLTTAELVGETLAGIAGSVLVDLSDCAFIDSTIIGKLVSAAKDLEREGYCLEIVAPPANTTIVRILEIVKMRGIVRVLSARPSARNDRPE